mgnify:CR=1 FL=1
MSSELKQETKALQTQFAQYCRDGKSKGIEGVRPDRIGHYKRLIHGIIEDSLTSAYPIAANDIGDEKWMEIVSRFIEVAKPSNPQLWKMPFELIGFVREQGIEKELNKDYLLDLLLFEWIEIEVHTMPDVSFDSFRKFEGDMENKIVVNPHFRYLQLSYPVFKIKGEDNLAHKGQYHLLVYRVEESGVVEFLELSAFLIHYLHSLQQTVSASYALQNTLAAFQLESNDTILQQAQQFVLKLQKNGLVLGAKKV